MTSRLDRLFILLESGSTTVTRRAAAKQIGEVQKLYPQELHVLLNRLISYLHSTSWDTRIAASQSVEAILANVPQWRPEMMLATVTTGVGFKQDTGIKREDDKTIIDDESSCQSNDSSTTTNTTVSTVVSENTFADNSGSHKERYLTFADFNLDQVLNKGARLFGSEGIEFDEAINAPMTTASSTNNSKNATMERLCRQRALLNEKLGLSQAAKLGINLIDMITDEDIMTRSTSNYNINEEKVPVEHILNMRKLNSNSNSNNLKSINVNGQQLSTREMNRAKRKARQNATILSNSVNSSGSAAVSGNGCSIVSNTNITNGLTDEPEKKKIKSGEAGQCQEIFYSLHDPVPDATGKWIDAVNWPLENFCACLYIDLFHPKWEVRHGAATALRELINHHASGAGKSLYMTKEEMEHYHKMWLEDAAVRLLCVLCLDRFGDFITDQVIAPVRETCAQVLGTIVKEMIESQVLNVVRILRTLLKQKSWEVRHGGLLGLKYIFVVQEKLLPVYLPETISDILMGLFDGVDDVGAVAASTLIPVCSWLPQLLSASQISSMVKMLWDLLLDQDELTSASNSFMGLLAAILSLPNASQWIQMESMSILAPRLWPFLSHSSSSVRKSTLTTLKTLIINNTFKDCNVKKEYDNSRMLKTEKVSFDNNINLTFDSKNLKLNLGVIDWQWKLVQEALRHIYQRILVEPCGNIQELAKEVFLKLIQNADLGALLHAACPFVSPWICLAMQPPRLAFDPAALIKVSNGSVGSSTINSQEKRRRSDFELGGDNATASQKLYLGGSESTPLEIREQNYMRARITATKVLGFLSHYLVQPAPGIIYDGAIESPIDCYVKVLLGHLNSLSSVQRMVCGLIIAFWALNDVAIRPGPLKLQEKLQRCVTETLYYEEGSMSFSRLLQEAHDLIAVFRQYKVPLIDFNPSRTLPYDQIISLVSTLVSYEINKSAPVSLPQSSPSTSSIKPKILEMLCERQKSLQQSLQQTCTEQAVYNIRSQAALAGSIVCLQCLPEKLNPIVKPLMESIKQEDCLLLQALSAQFLVQLMAQICDRIPSPNSKILNNLCMLLKSDTEYTPKIMNFELTFKQTTPPCTANESLPCVYYGILSLSMQQNLSNNKDGCPLIIASTGHTQRGPGRPPLSESLASAAVCNAANAIVTSNPTGAISSGFNNDKIESEIKFARIQRLGAAKTISELCQHFDADLINKLPIFEELLFKRLREYVNKFPTMIDVTNTLMDIKECNDLITSLQLIEVAAPNLHSNFYESLYQMLPVMGILIAHPLKVIRHMTARCIAVLADIDSCRTMDFLVKHLLSLLGKIESVIERQGAVEAIARVVDKLQIKIVPYIVVLVVPLLGCMSDQDECVRLLATHCFATLIQLMPLDSRNDDTKDSTGVTTGSVKYEIKFKELQARKTRDREFLDYLFTPKSIPDYKVPVPINVELRPYQQAGINWLWFLNKYNLHGILCDDMGLGKTLQTICIIVGDHYQRRLDNLTELSSLIICPPSLTGHWVYEMEKFLQNFDILRPVAYIGLPISREALRLRIGYTYNFIVTSYDTVRKDIDFFSSVHWNYCVLDEGHIIKNGKTKCSKAIKTIKANHRLILSGTPIQNNVLELWSLFDFLMPGFLGTEKQFIARYSRPILVSRESKSSSKEQEAGILAMEALHRQVLPFLLRRVKEDVLKDLPPKITQDLLCDLSPLQERLYEDFSRIHLNSDIKECLENFGVNDAKQLTTSKAHIFHALRYLQNVCNHPKLVLTMKHPEYERIIQELSRNQSTLDDIEHSTKLPALKQLLLDCGIGVQTESVSQHRALIFCQLKAMLDIVEQDLLRKHLPGVTYLRLDGSVAASMRQDIVHKFNTDPSIDVLLLTTQVGGLGLNLTGADTVIFVEHDWNPMKDLQAMDRAHRIGQKKVVNVYRLITRKSLEEKIMGLQKFKILTANTVVSTENASLETMATGQLFDLFNLNEDENNTGFNNKKNTLKLSTTTSGQVSVNTILQNLPELWSEQQYDEEYDITNFLQALKK